MKNLLLNKREYTENKFHEIALNLNKIVTEKKIINFKSKLETIVLVEVLYLIPNKNSIGNLIYPIIEYCIDYLRAFAINFTVEEHLFLWGMLNEYKIYDSLI